MRDEQVFFTLVLPILVFGGGIAVMWHRRRTDLRKKRLQVLEEALKHPGVDDHVRTEILRVLADEHVRGNRPLVDRLRPWLTVGHVALISIGWLCLTGGLFSWGYSELNGFSWRSTEPCIVAAIVGFVILTLPTAVREGLGRNRKALPAGR